MTYRATVRDGVVILPPEAVIENGTEVEVVVRTRGSALAELLQYAGTWRGDDADEIVNVIYRSRSSRDVSVLG
jgi:hypothetical protein